jgi:hypothetical protein
MKIKHITFALVLFVLGGTLVTAAPLGTAFTYQGRLYDRTTAVNGNYDLRFTLYDALAGGNIVAGPVTITPVAVANGLFTTSLDFGAGVFNGDARWLEIGARTTGSEMGYSTFVPRQPVTPAPYALGAGNAVTFGGQLPSYYAPAAGLAAYLAKSGDTMTGKLNLPANGLAAGINQLVLSGGRVGIGTPSPQAALDVAGTVRATAFQGDGSGLTGLNPGAFTGWSLGGNNGITSSDFLGTTDATALELRVNSTRGLRLEPCAGTVNVIGGSLANGVASGVVGATIAGGGNHYNLPLPSFPNRVNQNFGTISGGANNSVSGDSGTIGGGSGNAVSGDHGTVPGGSLNAAAGSYSFAAGYRAKSLSDAAFVWADYQEADFASTAPNQFLIRAAGGVGIGTTFPAAALDVNGTVRASGVINAVGGLVIENRTSDPPYPAPGQIWLRTDL